jgi:undecaprenyl-diphosphatase
MSADADHRREVVPRRDVVAAVVALVLVVPASIVASDGTVPEWEQEIFRWVNGWPDAFEPLMAGLQFLGVLVVPLVAAVVAAAFRRPRLAVALVLVVPLKLLVEKLVLKQLVERERPGTTTEGAVLRGDVPVEGESFPSGHAVIAFAIAWLLFVSLPPRWRWVPFGVGVLVCFARVYLGAHNPLDVVCGAGAGLAIGVLLDVVCRPERPGSREAVPSTLATPTGEERT